MNRWLAIALVGVTLGVAALMAGTTSQMPARVASHFDWNGQPDGWMDRGTYLIVMLAAGVALPWVAYVAMRFVRRVRDADYWLAPERRDATRDALSGFGAMTGIALALLGGALHVAIIEAHATTPVRLDSAMFSTTLALFVAAMLGLAIAYAIRFRRRPGQSMRR